MTIRQRPSSLRAGATCAGAGSSVPRRAARVTTAGERPGWSGRPIRSLEYAVPHGERRRRLGGAVQSVGRVHWSAAQGGDTCMIAASARVAQLLLAAMTIALAR